MSKIIITVEYTYRGIPEHEAAREAKELAEYFNSTRGYCGDKREVKHVQVIHQEENKT